MKRKTGFTLVELLVVIAIIGILISLLLPAVQSAREAARRMQCSNNLKQMGLAIHSYMSQYREYFPYGSLRAERHGLFTHMLPFLEQRALHDQIDLDGNTWDDDEYRYSSIPAYLCPSYSGPTVVEDASHVFQNGAYTCYQGVGGAIVDRGETLLHPSGDYGDMPNNGVFGWGSQRRVSDIRDGLSNTLMIGEFITTNCDSSGCAPLPGEMRPWFLGANENEPGGSYAFKVIEHPPNAKLSRQAGIGFNHLSMSSAHPGVVLFVFADGSVHGIPESIDFETYRGMATINGREINEGIQ